MNKSISKDELESLEVQAFEGETVIIGHQHDINNAVEMLKRSNTIGFDTETRPSFKKGQKHKVALLQLSTNNTAFLFRLNKTGINNELIQLFENPNITKVGVAIKDDIKALQKLKAFTPAGFIDIQDKVKDFNIENFGLKKLAGLLLGFRISKAQQTSNWEADELTDAQIKYAATDAWVSLKIYQKLIELEHSS